MDKQFEVVKMVVNASLVQNDIITKERQSGRFTVLDFQYSGSDHKDS